VHDSSVRRIATITSDMVCPKTARKKPARKMSVRHCARQTPHRARIKEQYRQRGLGG
jgi:hypothetical protein